MSKLLGPFLIALASILWATDVLFRVNLANSLSSTYIVFFEHVICVLVLLPWVAFRRRKELFQLSFMEWSAVALIGIGASAIATVFFTTSFRYINPSVTILLQKLQPVWVTLLAVVILKERPQKKFYLWALLALFAAIILSFPDFNFTFIRDGIDLRSKGVAYALIAAGLWGVATIAGKILLNRVPPSVVTFWRFVFGMATLAILLALSESSIPWNVLSQTTTQESLVYMGLISGLAGMIAYYSGMQRTSASTTTFVELIFPIAAVGLTTYFLHTPLEPVQLVAGVLLLVAVTNISYQDTSS